MVNEIVKGIAMQLRAAFGERYEIYQNDVEQGLNRPCFFVQVLRPENNPLLGRRALRRYPFDVHYFPERKGDNAELAAVGDRLFGVLDYIRLPDGSLLRGMGLGWEVHGGVLHFSVRYPLTVNAVERAAPMEELHMEITMKEGPHDGTKTQRTRLQ